MDSEQIKYFLQVAEDLNFTKASEHLFVSQSSVSKKISALEKELGLVLLERNHQIVKLTENGKRFVKFFSRARKEFYEEFGKAKYSENQINKILKVGVIDGYDLTKYLNLIKESSVDYQMDFEHIDYLVKGLYSRDYDLIIGQYKGIQQEIKHVSLFDELECYKLCEVDRLIIFSKTNKLYNKENLKIKDFEDQPFYIGTSLVALQNAEEICLKENIKPKLVPILHVATIEYELSKGKGFAIGDECSKIIKNQDFAYLKINHKQTLGYAHRNDISEEKKKSIKRLLTIFQSA